MQPKHITNKPTEIHPDHKKCLKRTALCDIKSGSIPLFKVLFTGIQLNGQRNDFQKHQVYAYCQILAH